MAKYLHPAESFLRKVRDTFHEQLSADAYTLYRDRLKKFNLPDLVWQALGESDRLARAFDKFPILPDLVKYVDSERWHVGLGKSKPDIQARGQYAFTLPGDEQRHATMKFPIGMKDEMRSKLPAEASDISLHVEQMNAKGEWAAITGEEEYKLAPENFPDGKQVGPGYVLSAAGAAEARALFRKGWIESGADPAKVDKWFDDIDRKEETGKRGKSDFARVGEAPADYDDSDITLGKQRIAQLDRLQEAERKIAERRKDINMREVFDDNF